ncbi:MAG: phosphopantetheine-binding protein [Bacteroidia bacterium]|nr:phosphopantetheine-binding protein [Bacteroidales bacterium]MDO5342581.1 phosphopantetheine-binding protein [Bacteroidia bacterium]
MSRIEIENKINKFLLEDIELEEELLKPEATLKDDLKIDSLDYVDIAVMIENTFGFKIKPEDMKEVITLDDFYKFIENKLG